MNSIYLFIIGLGAIIFMFFMFMTIEEILNLILRKGAPFLGFKVLTSLKERFRLALKVRRHSEVIEREYVQELYEHNSITFGIGVFFVVSIAVFCVMDTFNVPFAVIIMTEIIGYIAVISLIINNISEKRKSAETSTAAPMKKCEKCEVEGLWQYHFGKEVQTYAAVRMPDGGRYRMIPVINCLSYEFEIKRDTRDCIVYYSGTPFAKCCLAVKEVL